MRQSSPKTQRPRTGSPNACCYAHPSRPREHYASLRRHSLESAEPRRSSRALTSLALAVPPSLALAVLSSRSHQRCPHRARASRALTSPAPAAPSPRSRQLRPHLSRAGRLLAFRSSPITSSGISCASTASVSSPSVSMRPKLAVAPPPSPAPSSNTKPPACRLHNL